MELFHTKWNGEMDKARRKNEEEYLEKINSKFPIQQRINLIYLEYLFIIDRDLYDHLNEIKTEVSIFLQRWLRCVLVREFNLENIIKIWDAIFAYDMEKITKKNYYKASFEFMDYLCTTLIHKQRKDLLHKDLNTVYEKLLQLKGNHNVEDLIKSAFHLKHILKSNEDEKIIEMSKSMRTPQSSQNSLVEPEEKSKIKSSNQIIQTIELSQSFNSSDITRNSTFSVIEHQKEIKKLEHIYLKYKNKFSLKDSKEFLRIIIKLKIKNK